MLHNSRPAVASLMASLSLSLLNHVRPAAAADNWSASFVFPATTGYVMHNMDVMDVSYTSNYPNASLWAFCYNGKPESANQIIMGVYKNAHPFDGSQLFQFNNGFSSDNCWYNLRNLDDEERGLNGVRFSYDWKTRDKPSTLKLGSRPEITDAPSSTATDVPASTSATATPAPPASSTAAASSGASSGSGISSAAGSATAVPGSSSGAQSSGASASATASQSPSDSTKPPAGSSGEPPLLNNSTTPLINNSTGGGGDTTSSQVRLGSGIIAGIVVGAVLGVLGIVGFLAALWLMKRRRSAGRSTLMRRAPRDRESKDPTFDRAEVDGKCLPGELCGDNKPNKEGLVELPG
ncbi:hypothetical protein ISF_07241 [Cordyceps fumosorosea ARSEF 2679]|uniref:Uncharacterized protein n=1 Tax=Cordyceps fumosorosea (strain ARSEF 2679) TaxID=1081104 RepID=A0A167Q5R8_CORFA|nr:hypothetical protein ISF_07241 [Cordyceps fumosorosea ARSEF 2679]OAA57320.1 hypothetical protein ISF_07241 [Cordyceps fumosorosea ARSEF 2679]